MNESKGKNKSLALLSIPLVATASLAPDLPATAAPLTNATKATEDSQDSPKSVASEDQPNPSEVPFTIKEQRFLSYEIKSGDTVASIAKKLRVSIESIAKLNNLGPGSRIMVGQKLLIASPKASEPDAISHQEQRYKVRPGDSLIQIATKHGLTLSELTLINRINPSTIIYPGQVLRVSRISPINHQSPNPKKATISESTIAKTQKPTTSEPKQASSKTTVEDYGSANEVFPANPIQPLGICELHGFHTVQAGETVSKIAAVYGSSVQSLLSANSLTWSNLLYVGQVLVIPGVHKASECPNLAKVDRTIKTPTSPSLDSAEKDS
jgi:LysM repeat protein